MARYVDGFVLPVPKRHIEAYRRIAKVAAKVWKDHGALDYYECVGDDLKNSWGISFPKLTKIKPSETVVFAWISFKSRAHRDRVNAKVMKDKRMDMSIEKMPFDVKRLSYGGFKVIVSG